MQQKFQALSQKLKSALIQYPFVLAMALVMASTIVYMIETDHNPEDSFMPMRIIICAALGISVMFAIKMLYQRIERAVVLHVVGFVFLVGYFIMLPASEDDFTEMYAFIIVPTFVLSHLMVAFIPFLNKEPELKFWQYNKNLFINIFLTAVFTGVLTAGVELAIVSVDQLFNMDFKGEIYGETFAVLGVIGSVFIFLLFNERGLVHLEKDGNYPVVLKFFTQFILIPLLLIYVVILYLYAAKILFRWELPEGWVSYLVLAYSMVGILALLLVHPLKGDTAKSWVRAFSRIFYFSLLPLIVLLFVAIFTRVLEYGFTEPRYYVLLLAVWLLSVVLYFIFNIRATIKFIPVSLFTLGLLALVLPYFNAFSVSKRSQKHELELLLNQYQLLENHKINFNAEVPADVADNISNKFEFLSERFEHDYLGNYLDAKSKKGLTNLDTWRINNLFTNKVESSISKQSRNLSLKRTHLYDAIDGYQYVMRQEDLQGDGVQIGKDRFSLRMNMYGKNPVFVLKLNETEADFVPAIKSLFSKQSANDGVVISDSLFVERDLGKYHIKIVFGNLGRNTYNEDVNYDVFNALFFVREK